MKKGTIAKEMQEMGPDHAKFKNDCVILNQSSRVRRGVHKSPTEASIFWLLEVSGLLDPVFDKITGWAGEYFQQD